jgi:hypothetical protein
MGAKLYAKRPGIPSGIRASLTQATRTGIPRWVNLMICRAPLVALLATLCPFSAQAAPPPLAPLPELPKTSGASSSMAPMDVVNSAVAAVASLGDSVVLGRYQVAVERMNPLWKERTAQRMGGMQDLEKQLASVAQQMVQQGITISSFKPLGQPQSFEVGPGKKIEKIDGQEVESLVFSKWLILIPTSTKIRVMREGQKTVAIESIGFQVAISDKDKLDWTFIDGSGLTVNDLRSLFGTLPPDIKFPPIEKREAY